jgi:protein-tyrosine phosphatase
VSFSVLFVCTGNICRSPLGERMFRSRIAVPTIHVSSAGTGALVGYGIDGPSGLVLRESGVNPEGHFARALTREIVHAADLILTAESNHRTIVLNAEPGVFRRTFTMREFARLGANLGPIIGPPSEDELLRERVLRVAAQRGWAQPPEGGIDEIGDPYGAGLDFARTIGTQISSAVDGVIAALGLSIVPHGEINMGR